jgi:hypothetical protein
MFVTTIVAIGAAIVGVSVVLAVPLVPLMAAALLGRSASRRGKRRLAVQSLGSSPRSVIPWR